MPHYLVTGAGGFLGKYITDFLSSAGHTVTSMGRSAPSHIVCDLATQVPAITIPVDVVIHAAGKAHTVPKTEAEKQAFFDVNLQGTINLCSALEHLATKPKSLVFISTVAVYGIEKGENIDEQYPLDGSTPYAKSKIAAELFLKEWCHKNNVVLCILRLPLIAGNNPPGNLGAMINGIKSGRYFNIAGGRAKKSVVMASDVARWIPAIAAKGGTYNLTDGQHPDFAGLAALVAKQSGKASPKNIPGWLATAMALMGNLLGNKAPINTNKLKKITDSLTFNDNHARQSFGWNPQPVLAAFIIK